jgi:Na+-transporting methylmalonyl-CoA/oxaloacetate decarboxylase gamma subunit
MGSLRFHLDCSDDFLSLLVLIVYFMKKLHELKEKIPKKRLKDGNVRLSETPTKKLSLLSST